MDIYVLGMVVVRASIVYAFLFLVVRAMGKRKLGAHSALDLIVAVLLADVAGQAIFGSVSLAYGLFALAVVAGWHFAGHHITARDRGWARWLAPEATVVIRDGEILAEALRAERLSEEELWSLLRQLGITRLDEVKLATLESSGQLSVARQEWARELRKGDLRVIAGEGRQ